MPHSGLKPTPEEMDIYKRTARARWQAEQRQLAERRQRAWELARQAAELLRERFGVQRVVVFGSLVHEGRFTRWSDVDVAAWGLTAKNWLKAMAAVHELSDDITVNLVDIATCTPELRAVIERDGVEL